MPDNENRLSPVNVAVASPEEKRAFEEARAVSPTGLPMLPTAWVPWLTLLAVVAGIVAALPSMGIALPPVVTAIAGGVLALLTALGIASPGLRKK